MGREVKALWMKRHRYNFIGNNYIDRNYNIESNISLEKVFENEDLYNK